jgi:hypothetical protein
MSRRRETPDDSLPPDDDSLWRRPGDRFPSLPDETPPTAPLREPPRRRPPTPSQRESRSRDRTPNLLALFFFLASCGLIAYFAILWQNPYSPLNPLAPPTPLPLVITATPSPTLTFTPAPTEVPSPTRTPTEAPSLAPTLTFTPVVVPGIVTPVPTEDTSTYRFVLTGGRVIYITNPDARGACRWSSIAGSVTAADGTGLDGYGVHVVGEGIDQTVGTGSAKSFGPGGFEVPLGSEARDAQYTAQLVDPQGVSVSPVYPVATRSQCDWNIAALRFVETQP